MIYKVLYQPSKDEAPHRERTQAMYVEAASINEARDLVSIHTNYRIDFIEALSPAHLAYEESHNQDFKVVKY